MQEAYGELGRTSGPLKTWQDAFKPHADVVFLEPLAGKTVQWNLNLPTNGLTPGLGEEPALWELTVALLHLMPHHWADSPCRHRGASQPRPAIPSEVDHAVRTAAARGPVPKPERATGFLGRLRNLFAPAVENLEHPVGG